MAKATTSARRAAFDLAEHREELKALAERHGFRELSVFGSVARGEDTADSDIDLLVSGSETSPTSILWPVESAARTRSLTGRCFRTLPMVCWRRSVRRLFDCGMPGWTKLRPDIPWMLAFTTVRDRTTGSAAGVSGTFAPT